MINESTSANDSITINYLNASDAVIIIDNQLNSKYNMQVH